MGLRNFERRLERVVEGAFARAFRSGLRPVELGRRLAREMDDSRSIGIRGNTVAANCFTLHLSSQDMAEFADVADTMRRELADLAREHAREEGYAFMGPVEVTMEEDTALKTGTFTIDAALKESETGTGTGALILPGGERFVLGDSVVTLGRLPECNVVLGDPNASRRHAEVLPDGDGFKIRDLESTNGTKVNGIRIDERALRDGDELTFGATVIRFEAS